MTSSQVPGGQPFRFCDLPPDIRNMVYRLLLVKDEDFGKTALSRYRYDSSAHAWYVYLRPRKTTDGLVFNRLYCLRTAKYARKQFRYFIAKTASVSIWDQVRSWTSDIWHSRFSRFLASLLTNIFRRFENCTPECMFLKSRALMRRSASGT